MTHTRSYRALAILLACFASLFAAPGRAADTLVINGAGGVGQGKHVVLLSGDEEYRSEEAMPMLAKILALKHGFKCTVLFALDKDGTINPDNGKSLPGAEALATADVIVIGLRFRQWPDEQMKFFVDAFLAGKPIIALRTSTHAFNYPKDSPSAYKKYSFNSGEWKGGFGKQVLGETWVAHHGAHKKEATKGIVDPAAKDDPLLKGISEIFGDTDVYTASPPADAKILVRGQVLVGMKPTDAPVEGKKNDPMQPVVWTREYKNESGNTNKIFTTTMGSATDLAHEGTRRLIINSVFWAAGLPVPDKADVEFVDPFVPTMYGFKGYKKGRKVEDYAPGAKPKDDDAKEPAKEEKKAEAKPPRPGLPPSSIPLQLIKGERIALVGNSTAERFTIFGNFEALLHTRFPQLELVVRNFSRPADEVAIRQRSANYTAIDDPLAIFGPDTFIAFFGFNESFAGPAGIEKFKADYEKFIDEYSKTYARDSQSAPRWVIVSPIAFEPAGDRFLPNGTKENENLKLYAAAAADVAKKRNIPFIDVFEPTAALFAAQPGMQFTINGAHINEAGDREVALILDRVLFGGTNPAKIDSPEFAKLREAVVDKGWHHQQDHRMLNGWYVYGGRRTWDKETFPLEYKKIRAMVAVRDRYIWDLAQNKPSIAPPDDSKTGELYTPPTKFGSQAKKEPTELKYKSPEESIAAMTPAPGFEVSLFASEREFPELAKPVQLNFDNKGRLWVACMPTYPQWKPGEKKPSDRLLILEDTNGDGKADKCTTFYDKLHVPVGFEFWNGGVLVVDEPRIIFLKDTDGDDKADQVVQWTDGWATDDTHHCVNAWEWSPGGLLHMLEGVSMSTAVETPWGPMRNHGTPGCYVVDPRSMKMRHFVTPGYGNPWCYVWNWWGQGICGDGTSAQQHWDSPLSTQAYPGRKGLNTVFSSEGMRPVVGSEFLYTRQFPDEVQGQFIYACVINMNGLTRFEIGEDGAGYKGKRITDLLKSSDMNFRPTDPMLAPDGTLYFGDWCNALIGHMQYSQRDPNRDKIRGRIFRLKAKGRPLVPAVTQFGKPVPELLEQLKAYEPRTRYAARRELRDRDTAEVAAAVKAWVAKLDGADKQFDHHLCEAMWVLQGHHAVEAEFLASVLRAKSGEARAAATRCLADEWEYIPNAISFIKAQINDEHPRVRLEAVRALSYVSTKESVELILDAAKQPLDYWLNYTIDASLGALMPVWKPLLDAKEPLAANNPAGLKFLSDMNAGPASAAVKPLKTLLNGDASEADKKKAMDDLLKVKAGTADSGKAVFRRLCIACHKFGSEGSEFGPNISDVGQRYKRVDLIESVLDPSKKIDPKFATINIQTAQGAALSGLIVAEDEKTLTIRVGAGNDQKVEKANINKRTTMKSSSMPEGLAEGLSAQEFLDVIAFLESLKK